MANGGFYKAMERIAKFREEKEKKGKKKVSKATKPITPKTLAFQARTAHNARCRQLHHVMNYLPDRDGLPFESGKQLQKYMSNKSFSGKPKLKDLDEHARAYLAKLLEKDMGAGYKRELARLEALERSEEEEKEFQELEMKTVEEGIEQLEMDDGPSEDEMRPGFGTVLARRD